jgi:hypothetical protein
MAMTFEVVGTGSYQNATRGQVRGTLALLRYYKRFLVSDCHRCVSPEQGWLRTELTKAEARRRLHYLLEVAINRRGGIPDERGRKQASEYRLRLYRDSQRLKNIARRIRVYQFETKDVRQRFAHLLSSREE